MASDEFTHPQLAPLFTGAVAAHAIVVADDLGLFSALSKGPLRESSLNEQPWLHSRVRTRGVLHALHRAGLVQRRGSSFVLSELGSELQPHVPIFKLWFGGYASVLAQHVAGTPDSVTLARGDVVAESSSRIGAQHLDETILQIVEDLEPQGAICDIGCGSATRLLSMCKRTRQPGVGFDISPAAVRTAQNTVRDARALDIDLHVMQGDATALRHPHPAVDIVTQAFMTHHIAPDDYCAAVLRSYRVTFPNARYLVIFDTVMPPPSTEGPELFGPGFDYVHALQGMEPRSREAVRGLVRDAGYRCVREVELTIPHSYAWVMQPIRDRT
ncbi:class I SAM-dependent methyltransferase [Micromonospora okii]|uniref:class I SAM-dependent methyltransferase n=1 Tax=Micromonospora okii TaxID=1182970 RepID=UPI001E40D315|nr:class I SAM-dependent methyltransferase [Micromonospora okii]